MATLNSSLVVGCVLTATLALAGCNSDNDPYGDDTTNESTDNNGGDSGGDNTGALIEPGPNEAILYYARPDGDYEGWTVYTFNTDSCSGVANPTEDYNNSPGPDGVSDQYGAYFRINTTEDGDCINFIVHKGDEKDLGGGDKLWRISDLGRRIFSQSGVATLSSTPLESPAVAINDASAHWVGADTLLWDDAASAERVELRYSQDADIAISGSSLSGGEVIALEDGTLPDAAAEKFPHLSDWPAFAVDTSDETRRTALKGQLVAAAYNGDGELTAATRVQIPGVVDALYAYDQQLGATVTGTGVDFAVWAPTAQSIKLHVFDGNKETIDGYPVSMSETDGVWRHSGPRTLDRQFYQYEVTVYSPRTGQIETTFTTDPYAHSLSTNGQYAQVVNLDDGTLKPTGWDNLEPPTVAQPEDVVVYEAHIRDFSAGDASVAAQDRGKYTAFADTDSAANAHLQRLAAAGVTHFHLLPTFDIATVNEDPDKIVDIDDNFSRLCDLSAEAASQYAENCDDGSIRSVLEGLDPTTGDAQALYAVLRGLDSFNWGYDPVHYTVPEGSYATNAEGVTRIIEFREMVQALSGKGLNVVMDVVYNHTNASGLSDKSVLDKLVPGYYHRQNPQTGAVEQSSCCENTASEHVMMEKLMIDSLVTWTEQYKVSGFRFDLMGHHMKANMEKALDAVQAVDSDTYFYGEGWNFGEVADNARGVNAIQKNLAGTGIGSFNDRSRDAVRGGGPFDGGEALRQNQGFANGLFTFPNNLNSGSNDEKARLLQIKDWIRVGIVGGLADYRFENADGVVRTGANIDYNGQKTGYTADPQELVNYVSAHDNQTFWDNTQYKAAQGATSRQRAHMQVIGLSVPLLSQGIPFLHMGSEILRSKSMQRDSFDSGDWFNAVDFSYQKTTWNRGLPREDKDGDNWSVIRPILANSNARPTTGDITFTRDRTEELLRIRTSTPLLRLNTAEAIEQRLQFRNTGPEQIPGLIAYSIDDGTNSGVDLDSGRDALMVVINASPDARTLETSLSDFTLHDELDPSMGTFSNGDFTVPGLSVAVFEQTQSGSQGSGAPVASP